MEYHYFSGNNNNLGFVSENIYEALHEAISDHIEKKTSSQIKVIIKPSKGKKHLVTVDTLNICNNTIKSLVSNNNYSFNDLQKINLLYTETLNVTIIDKFYISSINEILNRANNNINNFVENKIVEQPVLSVSALTKETTEVLQNISKLTKSINTKPLIEKVKFKDEIENEKLLKIKKDNNKPWRHNFNSSYDNSENESEKSDSECDYDWGLENKFSKFGSLDDDTNSDDTHSDTKSENSLTETEYDETNRTQEEINILNEIKKIKEIKNHTNKIINNLENSIEEEKDDLSRYNCAYRDDEYKEKKIRNKLIEEYNKFVSERDNTYGIFYNKFFVKKEIAGFDCIPALFKLKFPIYLFLDGRNTDGDIVRNKILNTKDDFRLYKLLFDSLTSDDFEMPDDEDEIRLVNDFLDTFPDIPLCSDKDYMMSYNEKHSKYKRIFDEDETSKHSAEDDDDNETLDYNNKLIIN